jgi:hypothetical protein
MQGTISEYQKPNGDKEVRMHFPVWKLPNGEVVMNVTVFPHPCDTCAGGDHTHVEMNDLRPALRVIAFEAVELSAEHTAALDRVLMEKIAVDALTLELAEYLSDHAHTHVHGAAHEHA